MIPNIELNEEQLRYLLSYGKIATGGEATICEGHNPETLYKLFWNFTRQQPMSENKLKKIELLYQMQLSHSTRPINTISFKDMIIGYEMTTNPILQNYNLYQLNKEELIYFLNKTKSVLEYFSKMGVIYGDVEPRNILFNRKIGTVEFCDMDNAKVGEYPMDKIPGNLIQYEMVRGIDYGTPAFMHNIMTMSAHELYLYCCSNREIRKHFKSPATRIIHSMEEPKEFKGEYLITRKRKNR